MKAKFKILRFNPVWGRKWANVEQMGWVGQFALISELGHLKRISRIDRHGALYDASSSALTFDAVGQAIGNPSDFDEVSDVHIA